MVGGVTANFYFAAVGSALAGDNALLSDAVAVGLAGSPASPEGNIINEGIVMNNPVSTSQAVSLASVP